MIMWPNQSGAFVIPVSGSAEQIQASVDDQLMDGVSRLKRDLSCIPLSTPVELFHALEMCSPLAAIIGRKAEAFANGLVEVLNRNTRNYVRGQYKEWERLLQRPNPLQSRTSFLKQLYTFCAINGWCYVYPEYSAGFTDMPIRLWILPPWCTDVQAIQKPFYQFGESEPMRKVFINLNGRREEVSEKDLLLFTDTTDTIDPNTWLPESRLRSLSKPISNIVGGIDARNNLINKRGAIGFLSNDTKDTSGFIPMLDDEKQQLQQDMQRYGLTGGRWLYPITNKSMSWQQMAFNTKDLMLMEEHKACIEDICDRLNYPFVLLSNGKGTSFSNQAGADTDLYQNTIIPEAQSLCEQMNEGLKTPLQNIEIMISYDHLEAMQAGAKQKAEVRKENNVARKLEWEAGAISLNDWRKSNGDDTLGADEKDLKVDPVNPYNMRKPMYDKWLTSKGMQPQAITSPNQSNGQETPANG